MRSIAPVKFLLLRAGASLTLLALGLLAPSAARAGCAHPTASPARAVIDMGDLDPLILGAMPGVPTPEAPGRPTPCTGAFCSGAPAVPHVPTSVITPDVEQWACLGTPPLPPGPESHLLIPGDETRRPGHRGPVPSRPPRHFADSPAN